MSTDPPLSPFLDPQVYFGEDNLDQTLTSVMSSSDSYMNGTNQLSRNTSSSSSFSTNDTSTSSVLHNGYNIDQPLANTNFQNQMVSDLAIPSNALYNQTYAPWENQPYVPLASPTFMNQYSQNHLQMNSILAIPSNALYNQTYAPPWENQPYVPLANPYSQDYLHMNNGMLPSGNQPYVPLAYPTLVNPYPQDHYLQMNDEMIPLGNQPNVRILTPREEGLKRYFAKKHSKKLGKRVRYESRRNTAIMKRRMKGRFIKDGDEFDYDPTANNT